MKETVRVINDHSGYKVNVRIVKKVVRMVLAYIKAPGSTEIDLLFLNDRSIRVYNREYKRHDRPTDVLSFAIDRGGSVRNGSSGTRRKDLIGQICISIDMARKNSKVFGADINSEFVRYIIHAILHLFGFDDRTRLMRQGMNDKETEILEVLWKKIDLSKVLTPR